MPDVPAGAFARLNGADIYYETDGTGEPLLLLHGGTGCSGDWRYAGREQLKREYRLIVPDARGHGRSTNPGKSILHRQCAADTIALLDHLGIEKCKAIGISMGGNTLLHAATLEPHRFEALVLVSPAMYFPEQARAIMRQAGSAARTPAEWETMRGRHKLGDEQIEALWEWTHSLKDSYEDVNFTPPYLSLISASTLIVYGDRDPLYPVEMGVGLYRAIPKSALWVVPNGDHGPVFAERAPLFIQTVLSFFKGTRSDQVAAGTS